MTNIEKTVSVITIAGFIFALGVGWQSINSRFETLTKHIERVENDKAQSLCLAIMNRQMAAIERGKNAVRDQLQALSDRHCTLVGDYEMAAATASMTPDEEAAAEQLRQQQFLAAVRELAVLSNKLEPDNAECSEPTC